MKTQNKNFIYNVLYQAFIYIFPLITIPYISRKLGVDNIGIYSYTYSIVNCLMLFSMLGINNYGNREISKSRDDKSKMSKLFFSIYGLQLLCGSILFLLYLIYIIFFCHNYKIIFICQIVNFISVFFDINWFYFGLEQFKLTIRRNILIKLLSTVFIFLLVKNENNLIVYTIIMGTASLLSQLYLFLKLNNFIEFKKVHFSDMKKHLKSCIILFIPVLAYSVYRIMDKTMIGLLSSVTQLGYYENAEKIINIPIAVITALGTVMLPRMSYLLENKSEDVEKTISQSLKLSMLLAMNMFFGILLIASDGSIIIFGKAFAKSGVIMQLLSITIVVSAWASVFRTQYLIPKSKDNIYVVTTIIGAILNFILNLIFIPMYGAVGACIGTIVAELFLCVSQSFCLRKIFPYSRYFVLLFKELVKALIIYLIAYSITISVSNIYVKLLLQVIVYSVIFIIFNWKYLYYDFLGKGHKNESNDKK